MKSVSTESMAKPNRSLSRGTKVTGKKFPTYAAADELDVIDVRISEGHTVVEGNSFLTM